MPEEILVKCFLDTLTIANGKALRKRTEDAKKSNTVYFCRVSLSKTNRIRAKRQDHCRCNDNVPRGENVQGNR